jgi:hypothetical protein
MRSGISTAAAYLYCIQILLLLQHGASGGNDPPYHPISIPHSLRPQVAFVDGPESNRRCMTAQLPSNWQNLVDVVGLEPTVAFATVYFSRSWDSNPHHSFDLRDRCLDQFGSHVLNTHILYSYLLILSSTILRTTVCKPGFTRKASGTI